MSNQGKSQTTLGGGADHRGGHYGGTSSITIRADGIEYTQDQWAAKTRHKELCDRLDRIAALLESLIHAE